MNICGPVARKHRRTPPNRRPIRRSHAIRLYACVANNRANRLITHIISAAATRNYSHHRRCATCNANISLLDDVLHSASVCVCVGYAQNLLVQMASNNYSRQTMPFPFCARQTLPYNGGALTVACKSAHTHTHVLAGPGCVPHGVVDAPVFRSVNTVSHCDM